MIRRALVPLAAVLAAAALATPALAAAESPAWLISSIATPTNFKPGDSTGRYSYEVTITNTGGAPTDGSPITITDTLPAGLSVKSVELRLAYEPVSPAGWKDFGTSAGASSLCSVQESGGPAEVSCELPERFAGIGTADTPSVLRAGEALSIVIYVDPDGVSNGEALENRVEVEGGGPPPAAVEVENEADTQPAGRGFSYFRATLDGTDGRPMGEAASHPLQYTTSFALHTKPGTGESPFIPAGGDVKDIRVELPPGLVGNPNAALRCSPRQFNSLYSKTFDNHRGTTLEGSVNECPDDSAVGVVLLQQVEGVRSAVVPLYNLVPPKGMPAQFGFLVGSIPFYIDTEVRTGEDYGIDGVLHNNSQVKRVTAATVMIWGTPADPRHDPLRGSCLGFSQVPGQWSFGSCPASIAPKPFFRMPTSCGDPLESIMSYSTWTSPLDFLDAGSSVPAVGACDQPPFAPSVESKATTSAADSPSGLHFDLHNPQPQEPEAPGEADLKDATVTLPEGFVVNPSSADGLGACSEAQVGYTGMKEGRPSFTGEPAQCPDAAKIGTVAVKTPLVDHPLPGAVYLARQGENPFDSLLAIYITVNDPQTGVVVKLAGKVTPDPATGRLTTTVEQSPQLPFEDFELDFFEGARAPLRTPATCGLHTTTTTLVPWSAPEGPTAHPQGSFQTTTPAAGESACPTGGALSSSWSFSAGAQAPLAGAYSPFTVHLARPDGSQELSSLEVTLPPGVAARFAGVPECSDAQIAAAAAREVPGGGKAEQQSPSCPAASRIGSATVGAGAGPSPYYVKGDAYLGGPYKGAPFSIVVITPAVAGPFDLGAVVVRSALYVDPFTAQGTVKSDPIPRILDGIPLDVRSLTVDVDRSGFTLNPTSCEAKTVAGMAVSAGGARTALTNRFQVGECAALRFKPKLKIQLKGATRRIGHPALTAVLTAKPGEADIARAQVNLPHGEFLDQGNLNKTCTRPVLLAGNCPRSSVYGRAKAWTPLLDRPLEGPVYLVGGFGYKLPALVAELDGQVRVLLVGKVDSGKNKGIRNTFEVVPDAPVSRFELSMKGGKKYGLLENSEDLCKAKQAKRRAIVRFTGQNGKVEAFKPVVQNECGKHRKKHKKKSAHQKSPRKGRSGGAGHRSGR